MTKVIRILSILLFACNILVAQTPSDTPCNAPTIIASNTPGSPINISIASCCNSYTNFLNSNPSCGSAQSNRDSWFKIGNMAAGEQYNFLYIESGNRQTYLEIFELPSGQDCAIPGNFKSVKCARQNNVAFYPGSSVSATFIPPTASSSYYVRFQRVNLTDETIAGTLAIVKSYPNEEPCGAILLQVQPAQNTSPTFGNNTTAADWKPEVLTGPTCGPNNDVWYKFVATKCSMQIFVDNLSQSVYEMQAALMASTDGNCNNMMEIVPCGGKPDEYLDVMLSANNLTVGKTYYVIVDGYSPPYVNAIGNFSIEVFETPNAPACPLISSPCECGDPLTCGGTVLPNSAAGNAALAAATTTPNGNGCHIFALTTPPPPPLCGGNNTVEFCSKYTAVTGDELIAFDNVVGKDATCEVVSSTKIAYEEGVCATAIAPVCLDYNKKSPVFKVEAGKTYRFCQQIVTNGGDTDCWGKTYESYCAFMWKMPASATVTRTICANESVTIGTSTYNTSGTFTAKTTGAATGCDSTVTLNLTVLPENKQTISSTICNGATYQLGNSKYGVTGTYTATLKADNGCDSTVTLNLTVLPAKSSTLVKTICAEETLTVGTQVFDKTGKYTVIVKTPNLGCDSTVALDLTVLPKIGSELNKRVCKGESFAINGQTYSVSGNFDQKLKAKNGCDSTLTIKLTVLPDLTAKINGSICNGSAYIFGKQTLTKAGTYTEIFKNDINCDSTVTLTLKVSDKAEKTLNQSICEGEKVTVGSNTYDKTGTYITTILLNGGCDSTVTLNLKVNPKTKVTLPKQTLCFGQKLTLFGKDYTQSELITVTGKSKAGCDSTITVDLVVKPKNETIVNGSVCGGKLFSFGGKDYNIGGPYDHFTGKDKAGCDSTVKVIVIKEDINVVVSTKETSCPPGATDGGATITSPTGLDYTYVWSNGVTGPTLTNVKDGAYTVTVTNKITGCSKVQPVNVPKRKLPDPTFSIKSAICEGASGTATILSPLGAGDKYAWSNGANTAAISNVKAGSYTTTITDKDGCTSTGTAVIGATPPPFSVSINPPTITAASGSVVDVTVNITPPTSGLTLTWSSSNGAAVTATLKTGTTNVYTVTVPKAEPKTSVSVIVKAKESVNNCESSGSMVISIPDVKFDIPNVFIPEDPNNKDNTVLKPYENDAESYTLYSVYNRWGERVYHFEDAAGKTPANMDKDSNFWNGNYNNEVNTSNNRKKCPSDVYVLVLKYKSRSQNGTIIPKSQDVTLLR